MHGARRKPSAADLRPLPDRWFNSRVRPPASNAPGFPLKNRRAPFRFSFPNSTEAISFSGLDAGAQRMLKRLFLHYVADEARPMLRLAIPLVLAELGWMMMGVVDTM